MPLSKHSKVQKAIELYENFSGHTPKYIDTLNVPNAGVALKIGHCTGIMYTTIREGKREAYIHEFKTKSRPLLCTTFDGTQLLLIGGSFRFTERGIVDK